MPISEASARQLRNELAQILADTTRRVYAVMDGAKFEDLPAELAAKGIAHRPLFIMSQDFEMVRAGPWLVDPYSPFDDSIHGLSDHALRVRSDDNQDAVGDLQPTRPNGTAVDPANQLSTVLEIVGQELCVVFWIGDAELSERVLWRHLRTINKVKIWNRRPEANEDDLSWVIFRHPDPSVLAQSLPAFNQVQFARFLGPADAVLYLPEPDYADRPGCQRAERFDGMPSPPNLPLTLDRATIERIDERRARAIRRSIKHHLREVASEDLGMVTDAEISAAVERSEATARELGIRTAENRKKWAWLDLTSEGHFGRSQPTRQHLSRAKPDHDWDMDMLVSLTKTELRRNG